MGKTQDQPASLWATIRSRPRLDAQRMARAVEVELNEHELDYRSRLLIRRSVEAIRCVWPADRFDRWLADAPHRDRLDAIMQERFDEEGFPTLKERVEVATTSDDVEGFFRDLDSMLDEPVRLLIGGSVAAILAGVLERHTDDIDVADEVPAAVRNLGRELDDMARRHGLRLTHFRSHFLPSGWQQRAKRVQSMRHLTIYRADILDLFIGKLFSRRSKDRDDLLALSREIEKDKIVERLPHARALMGESDMHDAAKRNWYALFGEDLPDITRDVGDDK